MKNIPQSIFIISLFFCLNGYGSTIDISSKTVGFSTLFVIYSSHDTNVSNVVLNKNNELINLFFSVAPSPPVAESPVYYCQGSVASPLQATASSGCTLIWYGTAGTGGTASPAAPTPSTSSVGSTTYYVSQSDGTAESIRSAITVSVVANNGAEILSFRCDASQIDAADKNSSVFFDWANNVLISNTYNYTYTIEGGSPVSGTTSFSHYQIFDMLPGQSATLTLSSATHPCVPPKTLTCYVPCGSSLKTPDFSPIPNLCPGDSVPILQNISPNGISGTWNPAVIDNMSSQSYLFTPNSYQCASSQRLQVNVVTTTSPDFVPIAPICVGSVAPVLDESAPNGIHGKWSPSTIDNLQSANYIFNPDPNQCSSSQSLFVEVKQLTQPGFESLVLCYDNTTPILNANSPNGISGTWTASTIDPKNSGNYEFVPDNNQCASSQTINVNVIPSNTLTDFSWSISAPFAENQVVTIEAIESGNYMYQLDDGPFQDSAIFDNVSTGMHTATVEDKYGCSSPLTKSGILVVNYPKFFTPNDDSYHDTWNIDALSDDANANILIFDRFGKLLKEIKPYGMGWDGTFNGKLMPSNDYWFVMEYSQMQSLTKFSSHFSLKR